MMRLINQLNSKGRYTFISIILVCFNFNNYAQNTSYNFTNLNTSNGLSQSSVIKIHQDKLGQMWIGTRNGLNIYNGASFKIFRNDSKDPSSISNNDILSILEDISGNIWVGTYNGLNKYNPVYQTFERYLHINNNDETLPDNTINALEDMEDEIWIGTPNGLSIYNKSTKIFTNIYHQNNNEGSIPDNYISSILKTKKGTVLIGTSSGLCQLISRKDNTFLFHRFQDESNTKKNALLIQDLVEDQYGNIWVATKNKGLYKVDAVTEKLHALSAKKEFKALDKDIRAMSFDSQNKLWLGTSNGISILNSNGTLNTSLKTNSNLKKVKSVFTDRNGSVWVGTYYGSLNFWDKTHNNFKNFNQTNTNDFGYNVVGSIVADQEGRIYFGTEGGGVTVFDSKTDHTTYINKALFSELTSDNIKTMMLKNNELWLGTFLSGISVYNIKTRKVNNNNNISIELLNLLKETGVYSIKQENDSSIWMGTFGKGIIKYNLMTKTIKDLNSTHGLSNNYVRNILIDSNKRIWIGTQSGLNTFNIKDFESGNFKIDHFFYDAKSHSGTDILTVFEDSNENIWVGTKAKGLFKIKDNTLEKVLIKKGEFEITTIHAILEDLNHILWLSTNNGIVKYNTLHKTVNIYNQEDGLTGNEFISNAALKLNNQFYFGGIGGASSFNTERIFVNTYSPQVIITDFKIKNESVKVDSNSQVLNKSITYTENLTLAHNKSNFSIKFAAPNFINPANNLYSYRMVGLNEEWVTTTDNEATYTIQNSGTYTFEVRGANNEGIWNNKVTSLEVIIKPAPWKSWWAYTMYILLIGYLCFYVVRFIKSKNTLKHKLELEYIEKQRKEEANQAKLKFFTNISHEFRTPLTLILGPLQQLLQDFNGSNKMFKKLVVIEKNSNHLLKLINRLMDFRKLEKDQLNLQSAEANIVIFLEEIYLSFNEYAKLYHYEYSFETTDKEILIYIDRQKLEHVFYNLISNAFRYTPKGGTIAIKLSKDEDNLVVAVQDSGKGITKEYINKIFDRYFEVPTVKQTQQDYNKSSGIGLSIVKDIIELHKGRISVESELNKETIFTMTLPLGRGHLSDNEILKDYKEGEDISLYTSQTTSTQSNLNDDMEDMVLDKEKELILIVEDNKSLLLFIKSILKEDYNVILAEDGEIGFNKALKYVPDLIISDVVMPEMAGTEMCSKIKKTLKTSHIPVILLTSRSSLIYKYEGLESGADEYISKPFNLKEFRLKIKNVLDSTRRLKNKFSKDDYFNPGDITVTSLDEKLLKQALKIVDENIANEQFDILYFAKELGVSRTLLFAKIKAWANMTPNEFIIEMRMKRAIQLLEQSEISVSEISYRVGFKDPKYFSKCFRKKNQLSPTQFRNKFSERNTI